VLNGILSSHGGEGDLGRPRRGWEETGGRGIKGRGVPAAEVCSGGRPEGDEWVRAGVEMHPERSANSRLCFFCALRCR
jgi:hypothetical protein